MTQSRMINPAHLTPETGEAFLDFASQLQKGTFFREMVFNTGMVRNPEVITDSSYCCQILDFSYRLIDNYGISSKKPWESSRRKVAGAIYSEPFSNIGPQTSEINLSTWLKNKKYHSK